MRCNTVRKIAEVVVVDHVLIADLRQRIARIDDLLERYAGERRFIFFCGEAEGDMQKYRRFFGMFGNKQMNRKGEDT